MTWCVEAGEGDPALSVLPLAGKVTRAVADEMIANGTGDFCGECGKRFTAARKPRAVGRVRHLAVPAGKLITMNWLLCGKCARAMRQAGGVSAKLIDEARSAAGAAMLYEAAPKGTA